jgi:hypothetical protein
MERAGGENFITEREADFSGRNKIPLASQIASGKGAAVVDGAASTG